MAELTYTIAAGKVGITLTSEVISK